MAVGAVIGTGVDVAIAAMFWVEGAPHLLTSGAFFLKLEMFMGPPTSRS